MNCINCGVEIIGDKRNKYCSRACYLDHVQVGKEAKLKLHRGYDAARRVELNDSFIRQCIWRETKGKVKGKDVTQEMINEMRNRIIEARRHREEPKIEKQPKHCKVCGKETPTRHQVYCSDECRRKALSRKSFVRNSAKKKLKQRICKECGAAFMPEYGNKRRSFCSEFCCKKYQHRAAKASRRAKKKGNGYESFNPFEVFERDKWTCQICRIKTPRKLRGTTNDNAPELDHIVSLAEGGAHTMRNTQCLCRKCNGEKGATTKGQLRLFG